MEPHLTPKKFCNGKKLPIPVINAIVCYCPMPKFFDEYKIIKLDKQIRYFIHVHNKHVIICQYNGTKFLVISEVYGGPVGSTVLEELNFYGIENIVGLGFVGSFSDDLKIGSIIVANDALSESGTTFIYNKNEIIDRKFSLFLKNIYSTRIWTSNVLYREYISDIEGAKSKNCSVVNLETSHFYAVCNFLNIKSEYYAIVTNNINNNQDKLSDILDQKDLMLENIQNTLIQKILDSSFAFKNIKTINVTKY